MPLALRQCPSLVKLSGVFVPQCQDTAGKGKKYFLVIKHCSVRCTVGNPMSTSLAAVPERGLGRVGCWSMQLSQRDLK